jgi:ubiquitin carboxyl-terminal hydrolase 21
MVVQKTKAFLRPAGLVNSGNNCFFNASMQCVLSIHQLTSYYKNQDFSSGSPLSKMFQDFIKEYENAECVKPDGFIRKMSGMIKLFNGKQQDAHEFLIQFFEILYFEIARTKSFCKSEEEFSQVRTTNIIANTIYTFEKQILTCLSCQYASTSFVANSMILIDVCSTVQEGIDRYFDDVVINGEDAWKCDGCLKKKSSKKRFCIISSPSVLVVHISRFNSVGWKNNRSIEVNDVITFNGRKYDLMGVVCHIGTLDSGHYFSEAKRQGVWGSYNDTLVAKESRKYNGSSPYIVFYTCG